VMLFEMLTGHLPFEHVRGDGAIRFPQLDEEPADLLAYRKDLPAALGRVVATALQRDRSARFQGCRDFQRAIVQYRRRKQRRRIVIGASILVAMALVAAYGWREWVSRQADAALLAAKGQQQENEKRGRQTIQAAIDNAVKQLGSLCREVPRLKGREEALKTAEQAKMTDIADKFRHQIQDMRKNMSDYARGYAESIAQLGKFDARWVADGLASHQSIGADGARFVAAVREDHAAAALQRPVRGASELQASCPR
jgi:phage host-nuclease inhibitor protein Gam